MKSKICLTSYVSNECFYNFTSMISSLYKFGITYPLIYFYNNISDKYIEYIFKNFDICIDKYYVECKNPIQSIIKCFNYAEYVLWIDPNVFVIADIKNFIDDFVNRGSIIIKRDNSIFDKLVGFSSTINNINLLNDVSNHNGNISNQFKYLSKEVINKNYPTYTNFKTRRFFDVDSYFVGSGEHINKEVSNYFVTKEEDIKENNDDVDISIIIPCYNSEQYLYYTLETYAKQTFKRYEIIFVNDGSTDVSMFTLNRFQENYPYVNIKSVSKEYRTGISSSRNIGYKYISNKSKYVLFHDSDDFVYPNKLEILYNYMERHRDASAVGSACHIHKNGKIEQCIKYNKDILEDEYFHIDKNFEKFILGTFLFRRCFTDRMSFNVKLSVLEDFDYLSRFLLKYKNVHYLNDILHVIRIYDNMYRMGFDLNIYYPNIQNNYIKHLCQNELLHAKVALITMSTSRLYIDYSREMYDGVNRFFLKNSEVDFFVFTDDVDYAKEVYKEFNNVKIFFQEHSPWPGPTLLRFNVWYKNKDLFKDYDYIYCIDADMKFVDYVNEEIFADRVHCLHPGFFLKDRSVYTYDTNPECHAFVEKNEGIYYFAGAFYGGKPKYVLDMCETISMWINLDLEKNIIPVWDDESYLNRYCIDNPPSLMLTPEYCYYLPDDRIAKLGDICCYPQSGKINVVMNKTIDKKLKVNPVTLENHVEFLHTSTNNDQKKVSTLNNYYISLLKQKETLNDVDIIIPFKADSKDRIHNINIITDYIYSQFNVDIKLIVSGDMNKCPTGRYSIVDSGIERFNMRKMIVNYIENYSDFKKNVVLLGCDIIFDPKSLLDGYRLLCNGFDVVYPYCNELIQISRKYCIKIINSKNTGSIDLKNVSLRQCNSYFGDMILFNLKTFIDCYINHKKIYNNLVNEYNGRYLYLCQKQYKIARLHYPLFHLNHVKINN